MTRQTEVSIAGTGYTEEEVQEWFNCKFCGANVKETVLHEDQFGEYFCEEIDCVWEHVAECETVEVIIPDMPETNEGPIRTWLNEQVG